MPPSPLRYEHLVTLTYAANFEQCNNQGRYSMLETWQESFGPELEQWNEERRQLGMAEDYGRLDELKLRDANSNASGRLDSIMERLGEGVGGEGSGKGRGRGQGPERYREGWAVSASASSCSAALLAKDECDGLRR